MYFSYGMNSKVFEGNYDFCNLVSNDPAPPKTVYIIHTEKKMHNFYNKNHGQMLVRALIVREN